MKFKTNLKASSNLVDLTPLVDVIFLLLIFFMLSSDILPLKSLNVENPRIDRESTAMTSQVFVIMDAQHVIYLGHNREIVDFISFKEKLLEEIHLFKKKQPNITPNVVLSVDKHVDYGAFLRLFSLTQECNPKIRLVYKPLEVEQADLAQSLEKI